MAEMTIQCPHCGASGKAAIRCGCQSVDMRADEIPPSVATRLALPLAEIVREYFQQPGVQERYEKWLETDFPVLFPELAAQRAQRLKKAAKTQA